MADLTLDRVLTAAEALPEDQQEILEDLLRKRRIESWRRQTAAEAKQASKALQAGELKPNSAENIIAQLQAGLSHWKD